FAVIAVILALVFSGCPNLNENGSTVTEGILTINGLPFGGNRVVYIFSSGTDISGYSAITTAYANGSYQAVGTLAKRDSFTLYTWTGGAQGGGFTGTGSFPVLLLNNGGSVTDAADPMYSWAEVSFTNGAATVSYSAFTPVVSGVESDITYTLSQNGNENVTTTWLGFTFSAALTGLTADDITISGTGAVSKGTLTGSGVKWNLSVTVTTPGDVTVSIDKSGVESAGKPLTLYKMKPPTNWTAVTDSAFGSFWINGVAYGDGKWIAAGQSGKMAYSTDGQTWTAVSNNTFDSSSSSILDVTYKGGNWVAVGQSGKMAYSSDGQTWTAVTDNAFGSSYILGVAYGSGKWIAVGDDGKMAYSTDGQQVWVAVSNNTFGSSAISSVAYGSGNWVAVGASGKMAHSTDGEIWTAVSNSVFDPSSYIEDVAYDSGNWVAVANDGTMAYSPDGQTWTAVTDSTFGASSINAVAYGSGKWVAVGDNGRMAYSNPQE
ncbi:MAG: hypothetical protein LBI90_01800, partial [Treponema sp.]|nr:hypothetical protein [Treponema sp.]